MSTEIEIGGAVLGGIASLVATAISILLESRLNSSNKKKTSGDQLLIRIEEIKSALVQERNRERMHRFAGALLTFAQFIVGGLLVSSFLRESLNQDFVGALGLLVLFSSLVRQHYRPDVQCIAAQRRASKLKSLARYAEDMIFEKNGTGSSSLPSYYELLKQLTARLDEIEASKIEDFKQGIINRD